VAAHQNNDQPERADDDTKQLPTVFNRLLGTQTLGPLQMRGLIMFLPQFARVFWRLMADKRASVITEAVPFLGVLALISPALLELGFIPIIGELDCFPNGGGCGAARAAGLT
jgi:hypothetical protein